MFRLWELLHTYVCVRVLAMQDAEHFSKHEADFARLKSLQCPVCECALQKLPQWQHSISVVPYLSDVLLWHKLYFIFSCSNSYNPSQCLHNNSAM